ncbi:MAG: hypothetical protein EBU90_05095 [Proteobacteria bacterium]|nr:hypothetical protein [Pseudomonadota bacterium]
MAVDKKTNLRIVKCPLCDNFESKRLTSFEDHLKVIHKITTQELWDQLNEGPRMCLCGCGKQTKWIGWWKGYSQVINGHNGSIYKVMDPIRASETAKKRSESLKGKPGWARGLTKNSDRRIENRAIKTSIGRKTSFDEGKIQSWNKGLTAESDPRMASVKENLKNKFASGEIIPWAKGLSKDTDDRIQLLSQKVSLKMKQKQIRDRLDHLKRLSHEEIRCRIENTGQLKIVSGLENYINDAQKIIVVECNKCSKQFQGSLRSLQRGHCYHCSPGGSAAQEEVARWIESLGFNVVRNVRKTLGGLELDIVVEDKKFAVEYNGLYWHSHVNKTQGYHNNKTLSSEAAGIKLVHVFEDEWRDKQNVIKSMILSRLGISFKKEYARKCDVRELSRKERKSFFEENHADGDVPSITAWGLIDYSGEIVYAISVRRPFHKKYEGIEIARCCPKLNYNVPGGLTKLINHAKSWSKQKGHKKIVTYVDKRWGGAGEGYKYAGFKEISVTPPRFWWTDFENRYNRFKFKADSSEGLTEAQIADAAGVVKIWGCGNLVFELDI